MKDELKPSLWRTARVLANADRLNLLHLVSTTKSPKTVTEIAEEIGLAIPTVSIYLRALNARGLISVVRNGAYVYYGGDSDRSLPVAIALQNAFKTLFGKGNLRSDWARKLIPLFRAYSYQRRETLIRIILKYGRMDYHRFHSLSDMPEASFARHLSVLVSSGILLSDLDGTYSIATPKNPLESVLLDAVKSSDL